MFVKGKSGNPNGRPRVENSLSDIIRKKLKEPHPEGKTREDFIAERLLSFAETSKEEVSLNAILKIMDRLEGTPRQSVALTGENGGPVEVVKRIIMKQGETNPEGSDGS